MRAAFFLLVASLACGADLEAIRQTQTKLIAMRGQNEDVQGANPELTILKHQIRDWVESQIAKLNADSDLTQASAKIDSDLDRVKLGSDDGEPRLGGIDSVSLEHPKGDQSWLSFKSIVELDSCGRDSSLYLYEWRGGQWTRRLEIEHDDYGGHYGPIEFITSVEVSRPDDYQNRLVLVLGNSWGCASMWQGVSYVLFRVVGLAKTLLDGSDTVYMGSNDDSYHGRLEPDGALIEHLGWSTDTGVLIRRHVLHYKVDGDSVRRVEPIALDAQDFVDEWLSSKWADVAPFSDPKLESIHANLSGSDPKLEDSRAELHAANVDGGFQIVQRCTENPNRWQVAFDFEDETDYFLVEQRGEYSFRMIDISDERQSGCPGEGKPRQVGDPSPTLFPETKNP
jgi:hypothetical protein